MQNNSSKEIIYNILRREVHNIIGGIPMLSMFETAIANYVIAVVDPYVSAFTDNKQTVDVNQLSSYVEYEVQNKISKFKEIYNKETEAHE